MHPKNIFIADYTYNLPKQKIAGFPLQQRDTSKLLIYRHGLIEEDTYKNIASYLPEKSLLIFNNTKVIPARILFKKSTGKTIELFCLEPYDPKEWNSIMGKKENAKWKCLVGGAAKWKDGNLEKELFINNEKAIITVSLIKKLADEYIVEFSWRPVDYSFAEIIQYAGETPLPPYIKRKANEKDKERYQTIYAIAAGAVAAPTAGLHFTKDIFSSFTKKNITTDYVTLHVGAGTFKPVKALQIEGHEMHAEWMEVNINVIQNLINNLHNNIVAAGTTSLRTIESLYWMGVKAILYPDIKQSELLIHQWEVYEHPFQ
jgi:S-adenosylmethionine:tRNA ribosyltransferase-isomerase